MKRQCPYELFVLYCTDECPVDKCKVLRDIVERLQDEVAKLKTELILKEAEHELAATN